MRQGGYPKRKEIEVTAKELIEHLMNAAQNEDVLLLTFGGKDIRQQVVWVEYGIEGARHELRMPYGDAVKLRDLLVAMKFMCTRCGRKSPVCTATTCYEPVESWREVR